MFTGIITAIGHIQTVTPLGTSAAHGVRLQINTPAGYLDDVALGDSIALNGACMTVTSLDVAQQRFTVDVSAESLDKTTGLNAPGRVNLEKALRMGDRLGGHLVSGHVDGVGTVTQISAVGESFLLQIQTPAHFAPYVVEKGSITVNGVSLTLNTVDDVRQAGQLTACAVRINLIPHTMQHTTLGDLQAGSLVNLEIDTIARYVQRLVQVKGPSNHTTP